MFSLETFMALIVLAVRLLLACVFLVAAAAKLADRAGFGKALNDFGIPARIARPLRFLTPLAEAATAVLLIPGGTARWGAVGALGLLVVFSIAIGVNLTRGRKPDCHCFGQLHSSPAGWTAIARNGLFAAGAGFLLWKGGRFPLGSVPASAGGGEILVLSFAIAAFLILGVEGWVIFHLLRQHGRMLTRIVNLELRLNGAGVPDEKRVHAPSGGLPTGSTAPAFSAPLLAGGKMALGDLQATGKPVLLVFSDVNCGPCNLLMPHIADWQREHAAQVTLAVLSHGSIEEHRQKLGAIELQNVMLQEGLDISEMYRIAGTPSGVLLSVDGTVSATAAGPQAIADLVAQATVNQVPDSLLPARGFPIAKPVMASSPRRSRIGESAPAVRLPALDGRTVELAGFKKQETLVLLWNPNCGYCKRMLPELQAWEKTRPADSPNLYVISTGTEEANRALGLESTLVLDQEFGAGRAFGIQGTPSAVLVDDQGRIASEIAVGAKAVMALASRNSRQPIAS